MHRPKAHGPGPSELGLRSSGQRPRLGCVSPLLAITATRWMSSSCRDRRWLLMMLRASWFGLRHSCIGGRSGAGVGSGYGAATPSYSAPSGYSDERMERCIWCIPAPWWGERLRVSVATWSSPPNEWRRSLPALGGFGGPSAPVGQQAREGHAEASPPWQTGNVLTCLSKLWGIIPPSMMLR